MSYLMSLSAYEYNFLEINQLLVLTFYEYEAITSSRVTYSNTNGKMI